MAAAAAAAAATFKYGTKQCNVRQAAKVHACLRICLLN